MQLKTKVTIETIARNAGHLSGIHKNIETIETSINE